MISKPLKILAYIALVEIIILASVDIINLLYALLW